MALSDKAKKVASGLRKGGAGHDVSSQPRGFHGRFGSTGAKFVSAPKLQIDPKMEELFKRMTAAGASKSAIIAEAERQGIPNAKGQFASLWREKLIEEGKRLRTRIRKKKGDVVPPKPPEVKPPVVPPVVPPKPPTGGDEPRVTAFQSEVQAIMKKYDTDGMRLHKIRELISAEEAKQGAGKVEMWHGMDANQMYEAEFLPGKRIHWPANKDESTIRTRVAEFMMMHNRNPFPPEMYKGTHDIYFGATKSVNDARSAIRYGIPGFTSAASAAGGMTKVVFYRVQNQSAKNMYETLAHELGHNVAQFVYGHSTPGIYQGAGGKDFHWLWANDTPPSRYSRTEVGEALAEAVRRYFLPNSHHGGEAGDLTPGYKRAVEALMAQARIGRLPVDTNRSGTRINRRRRTRR